MTRQVSNITVEWISLVSKSNTPAVEQAENTFALFKTMKKNPNNEILNKILENIKRPWGE